MKFLKTLFVCLALGLAGAANAETCTSSGSGRWTAVGTGPWTGCTATNDDTFNVASGHIVYVDGTVTVTTGNVVVQSGGTLNVTAGSTLSPGASLYVQDGATIIASGAVRNECRIASEPAWDTDDTPDIVLDCGAAVAAGTSDYVVFLSDDPVDGFFNRKTVHAGPGFSPGAYDQALNRYAWYDITNVAGSTVTFDLDSGTYAGGGDAPYQGTRGLPTVADITTMTFTLMENGLYTRVVLDAGGPQPVAMHGDLGSMYLYFEESAANAANPAYCSGLAAKIVHSENDAVGGDQLYVMGDVTRCTSATARVIPGARRGDRVALVTPATIDGIVGAAHTGYVRIETGSTVQLRWSRFHRLGFLSRSSVTPNLARNCNICFIQSSTNPAGTFTGWFTDSDVAFPEANGTNDTGVVYISGMANSGTDLRYPNIGPIDMRGLRVERLHIHDSRNAVTGGGGGGHGLYMESVRNLTADGIRSERMSDDGVGGLIVANSTGTSDTPNSLTVKRILSYEHIAEDDNSQQAFEISSLFSQTQATDSIDNFVYNAGALHSQDVVAIGSYDNAIGSYGLGHVHNRIVNGGVTTLNNPILSNCVSTGATADGYAETIPMRYRNSLISTFQIDGGGDSAYPLFCGTVEDSIIYGMGQSSSATDSNTTNDRIWGITKCLRTAIFYEANQADGVIHGNGTAGLMSGADREFRDCLITAEVSAHIGDVWDNSGSALSIKVSRLMFATTAAAFQAAGAIGPLDLETGVITATVDGFWATNAGPGTEVWDIDATGSSVANSCIRNNSTASTVYGSLANSSTVANPDLFPLQTNFSRLGTFIQNDGYEDDPCEASKPIALGLSEIGTSHVLMGDFFIMQLYPTFTSHKGLLRVVGQQSVGSVAPTGLPSW